MAQTQLPHSDQKALNKVIETLNFQNEPKIEVQDGSALGSGYTTKTFAVTIKGTEREVRIFMKTLPKSVGAIANREILEKMFKRELHFYENILPALMKFQDERVNEDIFNNTAKYFYADFEDFGDWIKPIILENTKPLGYTLWDKETRLHEHLILIITTYAKYHALSFAMKDQQPDLFKKITFGLTDLFDECFEPLGVILAMRESAKQVLDSLYVNDRELYEIYADKIDHLTEFFSTIGHHVDDYAIVLHGDCWPNNLMYKYDQTGKPIDVKLCDFQIVRYNSPALDLSYIFSAIANKETLDNADYYLKFYHKMLTERIRVLGSDPEKLYPLEVFQNHWKKFSKFGLTMAFLIVKAILFKANETPDLLNSSDGKLPLEWYSTNLKKQDIYIQKMVDLMRYYSDNKLI